VGSHKKKGHTSYEEVPVRRPDFNVTGTLSPDATCNYFEAGTYNGYPYYQHEEGNWFLWAFVSVPRWIISETVGDGLIVWRKDGLETPVGAYDPYIGCSGIATVSAGAH
jgi:hypothetical protein